MEWVRIRIPAEMIKEIREIIKHKELWASEQEFIRDAIRRKIMSLVSDAVLNYIKNKRTSEHLG